MSDDETGQAAEATPPTEAETADERVERPVQGVTVYRTRCHSSLADFEGERCPRCGINCYDWLLYGEGDDL
jgi:hypothetical protein